MGPINRSSVAVALSSVALFSAAGGRARRTLTAIAL